MQEIQELQKKKLTSNEDWGSYKERTVTKNNRKVSPALHIARSGRLKKYCSQCLNCHSEKKHNSYHLFLWFSKQLSFKCCFLKIYECKWRYCEVINCFKLEHMLSKLHVNHTYGTLTCTLLYPMLPYYCVFRAAGGLLRLEGSDP